MTFTLRKATESDAADACETVRRSIIDLCEQDHHCDAATLEDWLGNKTEVNFKSWINSDRHVAIVAEHLAAIIGFALLSRNEGRLLLLCVSPDARFQGVSRAMLAALESEPSRQESEKSCWTARLRPSASIWHAVMGPIDGPLPRSGVVQGYPMAKKVQT